MSTSSYVVNSTKMMNEIIIQMVWDLGYEKKKE